MQVNFKNKLLEIKIYQHNRILIKRLYKIFVLQILLYKIGQRHKIKHPLLILESTARTAMAKNRNQMCLVEVLIRLPIYNLMSNLLFTTISLGKLILVGLEDSPSLQDLLVS
jgi:hypothetical protein